MNDKIKKDWKKFKEESDAQDEQTLGASMDDSLDDDEQMNMGGELEHLSYAELEEKLTLAEQKAHDNWEKSVRAMAEVDNIRRRAEREVANAHRYSLEKFVTSLLPVVDSLEQALQLAEKNADTSMHEGLLLTMKLFLDVLGKYGVEQLDPQGEAFDPQQHEAMSMQDSMDVPHNAVLLVFQKGYKLNDRVIRPARVIVAKGKAS